MTTHSQSNQLVVHKSSTISGLEDAQAILKRTSTAIKIISTIKCPVEEDKRSTKLLGHARRKVVYMIDTISKNTSAIDEHKQLCSIMLKCTKNKYRLNREITKLADKFSEMVTPHLLAEAIVTADQLDRILSQLKILETRIEIFCTTALTISGQVVESEKIKTLIETKQA